MTVQPFTSELSHPHEVVSCSLEIPCALEDLFERSLHLHYGDVFQEQVQTLKLVDLKVH